MNILLFNGTPLKPLISIGRLPTAVHDSVPLTRISVDERRIELLVPCPPVTR